MLKESKISWEPLPSTIQDYSSSSDLENFEEGEASSETWTIVERKLLNDVLEQSVYFESDSKILQKWQALDSKQNGHEVHKKQPNDNSKVNSN